MQAYCVRALRARVRMCLGIEGNEIGRGGDWVVEFDFGEKGRG